MTQPIPPTLLVVEFVTGGGLAGEPLPASWAAEGRAMRRAIAADFTRVANVVVSLDDRFAADDDPWTTARIGPGEFSARLAELARRADYTMLVAPETTGVLERTTIAVAEAGGRLLGSTPAAAALAADKAALARRFERLAIPTPCSRVIDPRDGPPGDWAIFPAVLKPIDGAGSIDTFRIEGPSSLPADARTTPAALLQPLAPGSAMSASFLVSAWGEARLIAIGRQHMAMRDGRFVYEGGTLPVACPGALSVLNRAVESVEGLRGFVGVDFLWDAERREATVLEINPRATTSVVGLCRIAPPGLLATAWLAGFAAADRWEESADRLKRAVEAAPRVRFRASGEVHEEDTR